MNIIPIKKNKKEQIEMDQQVYCEWINTLNCRRGFLKICQNMLVFKYESGKQECNHISLMGYTVGQNKKMSKEWPLEYIREVRRTRYLMKKSAISILMLDGNQLVFDFKSTAICKQIFNFIVGLNRSKAININIKKSLLKNRDILNKNRFTQMWVDYQISNFEYLMILNELSNRTMKDIT